MASPKELRARLEASVVGKPTGVPAVVRLCETCVDVLGVDGAALTLPSGNSTRGTFGSSGSLSRQLDEFQFTFGEGPCLDCVRDGWPVLVPDFEDPRELRWPAFVTAVLGVGVRAIYSLPVVLRGRCVGVLELYRLRAGPLTGDDLLGALLAAGLVARPLDELLSSGMGRTLQGVDGDPGLGLGSLQRVEVYQATGMVMGQLRVGADEALIRLRAHAFTLGMTASELAWEIVQRRVTLIADPPA